MLCDNEQIEVDKTFNVSTKAGLKKLCSKCTSEFYAGKLQFAPEIRTDQQLLDKKNVSTPEVQKYLSSIHAVTDPQSVPHPSNPEKKMSQEQLFAEYLKDEQTKIVDIFGSEANLIAVTEGKTVEGLDLETIYRKISERQMLLESIVFEGKTRASETHKVLRKLDAASGRNRWDKESRGQRKGNLSDPRHSPLLNNALKEEKKALSKMETMVRNFLDLGSTEDEITTMLQKKYKINDIVVAIKKIKGE